MKLNRTAFLDAIKFLISSLSPVGSSRRNLQFLHVKLSDDKCILTAANGYIIKRVTLQDVAQVKNHNSDFLIPQSALLGFEKMVEFQRKIHIESEGVFNEDEYQDYQDYEYVEIIRCELKAKHIEIKYRLPEFDYPDLINLFNPKGEGCKTIGLGPHVTHIAFSDFPNKKAALEFTVFGPEAPVIINQIKTGYQVVIMPCKLK